MEYLSSLKIDAKNTKITNSIINTNEIFINSKSIDCVYSSIFAKNGAVIENLNCDFIGTVVAPFVCYNGTDIANNLIEQHTINLEELKLREAKQKLSNHCKQLNNAKRLMIKNNFEHQPIVKALKK